MSKRKSRLLALAMVLALSASALAVGIELTIPWRVAAQTPIYALFRQYEFNEANCMAGWQVDYGDGGYVNCTGNTARLGSTGNRYSTALLWRNDAFPASGNLAIEARFRYPFSNGAFGNDALTAYDRLYNGRRLIDNGMGTICTRSENRGWTWIDPGCPDSAEVLGSHAAGWNAMVRADTSYDDVQYVVGGTNDWFTVVWEYTAATDRWTMRVDRASPANGDTSHPWAGPFDFTGGPADVAQGRPVGLKFGHHIQREPWPGSWNEIEVDYVRIWTWDTATPTPTSTPTPSTTPTRTPTPTPTRTPTPTPTSTSTPTPTPTLTPTTEPVTEVRLTARYPRLVYYGPQLGLPAQTLDVLVVGGDPPYSARVYAVPPDGIFTPADYVAGSNPWSYGAMESGDPYFGVSATGMWIAQVMVGGISSNIVSWEVHWYPVHVVR